VVLFFYAGERAMQRQVRVCDQPGGCATSAQETYHAIQERFDQHGRLYEVVEPSAAGGANVTTRYAYDAGNRLREVRTIGAGQVRRFEYDHRGFLTRECHPEKGASGNGCVTYLDYDALGKSAARTTRRSAPSTATTRRAA
jgi:YD repeat-containing protein